MYYIAIVVIAIVILWLIVKVIKGFNPNFKFFNYSRKPRRNTDIHRYNVHGKNDHKHDRHDNHRNKDRNGPRHR